MAFRVVPADLVTSGSLAGSYTLTGTFLESPDYLPGVSGWAIFGDGSAEFNNGTFRGMIAAASILLQGGSGEVLVYSGPAAAGNLIGSLSALAGVDSHGNTFPAGLQVINASGQGVNLKANQLIFLGSNAFQGGGGGSAAYLFAPPAATLGTQSVLFVVGPTDNTLQAILQLRGETGDGTQQPYASFFQFNVLTNLAQGGVPLSLTDVTTVPTTAPASSLFLYSANGQLCLLNSSGLQLNATGGKLSTGSVVVANTVTETVIAKLTVPAGDVIPGAVYTIKAFGQYGTAATAGTLTWSVKWGGAGGVQLVNGFAPVLTGGVGGVSWEADIQVVWTTLTETLSKMRLLLSTGAATDAPSYIRTNDITGLSAAGANDLVLTVKWGTAAAANTLTAFPPEIKRVA